MRKIITLIFLLIPFCVHGGNSSDLRIVFWNLENFFDYHDNGNGDADTEFSSRGKRYWSSTKFTAKCNLIAKALLWMGEKEGQMPEIISFAEVENRWVLERLFRDTPLRKYPYSIVHYDSSDPRGIDVALAYRKDKMELLSAGKHHIIHKGKQLLTRDILRAEFLIENKKMALLVNHHPSKYGGKSSSSRRSAALASLSALEDSLYNAGVSNMVITGDFNETPEKTHLNGQSGERIINLATPLSLQGKGTIRYNGKWELIDMFMVSSPLEKISAMNIIEVPFLMVWDNTHSGLKPYRTYSGPRYIGGVSDHCPILLSLREF